MKKIILALTLLVFLGCADKEPIIGEAYIEQEHIEKEEVQTVDDKTSDALIQFGIDMAGVLLQAL